MAENGEQVSTNLMTEFMKTKTALVVGIAVVLLAALVSAGVTWLVAGTAFADDSPVWPQITQCQVVHPEDLGRELEQPK